MYLNYLPSNGEIIQYKQGEQEENSLDFNQDVYTKQLLLFSEQFMNMKNHTEYDEDFIFSLAQTISNSFFAHKKNFLEFLLFFKHIRFDIGDNCHKNFANFALCHFLPSFWRNPETNSLSNALLKPNIHLEANFFETIGFAAKTKNSSFYDNMINILPKLLMLNPFLALKVIGQFLIENRLDTSGLDSLSNGLHLELLSCAYNNFIINKENSSMTNLLFKLNALNLWKEWHNSENGVTILDKFLVRKGDNYSAISSKNSVGKVIVIRGCDPERAFIQNREYMLAANMFDVILFDSKIGILTLDSIINAVINNNFSDFEYVIIKAHGIALDVVNDSSLSLNDDDSDKNPGIVMVSSLIKALVSASNKQPLKIFLDSCESQLSTHKLADILPNGSEIITTSEYQYVLGKKYAFNTIANDYKNTETIIISNDLRKEVVLTNFHLDYKYIQASPTYAKIGVCNFRTAVNLSQKDVTELLSKTNKFRVLKNLVDYLQIEKEDYKIIRDYTLQLLEMFKTSRHDYPLLEYRSKISSPEEIITYNKYLGIAGAIYAIYDKCGNGLISDSEFTPKKDNFFASNFIYNSWSKLPQITQFNILNAIFKKLPSDKETTDPASIIKEALVDIYGKIPDEGDF